MFGGSRGVNYSSINNPQNFQGTTVQTSMQTTPLQSQRTCNKRTIGLIVAITGVVFLGLGGLSLGCLKDGPCPEASDNASSSEDSSSGDICNECPEYRGDLGFALIFLGIVGLSVGCCLRSESSAGSSRRPGDYFGWYV